MHILFFYIPISTQSEAASLGRKTIEARLAACSNVFPIQSTFPWEGSIQQESEYVLILKTIPSLRDRVISFIEHHHPYDIPGIIHWNVDVNEKYGEWIKQNVSEK